MKSINPYTQEEFNSFSSLTNEELFSKLDKIGDAYQKWKGISLQERIKLVKKLGHYLLENHTHYAELATKEMGKPIQQARAEVNKCALLCNYYAEQIETFLTPQNLVSDYASSKIVYQPIGAILGVMPWNYPYWQVFRFAIPTILAGNVAVLKHASNVPSCALALEDLFREVGFSENIFTTLLIPSSDVEQVIQSEVIQAVTLTGSEQAGSIVASQAGKAIKKTVLELGGSDAFIVLNDADLEKAISGALSGRFQNNGQSCIASKRFIIQEEIYDEFIRVFTERVESLKLGDPMKEYTDIGPLAQPKFVQEVAQQVNQSVEKGAMVVLGGRISGSLNQFYQPTILSNVRPGMPAFDEELFGPVAACIRFETIEEAINLANQSPYGLGGSVWTETIELGIRVAQQIETGTVSINDIVKSDPRIPFGGIKQSGYGSELSSHGLYEFLNLKVIHVNS